MRRARRRSDRACGTCTRDVGSTSTSPSATRARQPWTAVAFRHTSIAQCSGQTRGFRGHVVCWPNDMLPSPAIAFGPDDEVVTIDDEDILDDDDDCPLSVLDPEKAHDDAC